MSESSLGRCQGHLRGRRAQSHRPGALAHRPSDLAWAVARGLLLLVLLTACESTSPVSPRVLSGSSDDSGYSEFSGAASWRHLEALAGIGPRVSGTDGSSQAQAYLRAELEAVGAEVSEYRFEVARAVPASSQQTAAWEDPADLAGDLKGGSVPLVSLVGVLPGASDDIFLLAAPYDTAEFSSFRFVGANGGASGPALLLEIARVLASRDRPYTVWLVFVDGDALAARGTDKLQFVGSELLSQQWAEAGTLERVRFAVFVDRVADADLSIARDLWSHSVYRDLFWQAARELGYTAEFADDRGFESPASGHRALLDQRMRRVVALVDNRYGAGEPPGSYWRSEDDTILSCSPDSLTTVGQVTLKALFSISQRLEKIDRFSRSPF